MNVELFITLVKKRSILYDPRHPLYRDKKEKDLKWAEICATMGLTSDFAKTRWKSLKDCYSKHLKSGLSTTTDQNTKYIHWQWAKLMEFMKPHLSFGPTTKYDPQEHHEIEHLNTQSSSDVRETQDIQETESGSSIIQSSRMLEKSQEKESTKHMEYKQHLSFAPVPVKLEQEHYEVDYLDIQSSSDVQDTQDLQGAETSSNIKSIQTRSNVLRTHKNTQRRRRRTVLSSTDKTSPYMDRNIIRYLENKKQPSYDATELIFLGYAKSLKQFSIQRQARIKMKIAKLIIEEEVAHYNETMSHSRFDSDSSSHSNA